MKLVIKQIAILLLIAIQINVFAMSDKEFIVLAFNGSATQATQKTLWLNDDLQSKINKILDHRYPKLRLRYWQVSDNNSNQSVWFLDEIGKERPISFGISIINNRVSIIEVLEFRESRGGEIQIQSFSEQFTNIGLNDNSLLDRTIDGISGATMSVSAMKKITRVALMLHREVFE